MTRFVAPTFEEVPSYMAVMGMRGARFLEGNDGSGSAGAGDSSAADEADSQNDSGDSDATDNADNANTSDDSTGESTDGSAGDSDDSEGESEGDKPDDDFKSDASKKSLLADLRKARDDRNLLRTENETLTESIAERDATITAKDAELTAKDTQIEVLKLAASHHIEDESDIELLGSIADSEKRSNLAKRLASDARNRVNRRVGSQGGGAPASSLDAGRDLYASRKKKK